MQFEKNLGNKDINLLLTYKIYKIVNYIQIFHSEKILRGYFDWLQDDDMELQLVNAIDIQHIQITQHFMSNESFYEKMDDFTEKKLRVDSSLIIDNDQDTQTQLESNQAARMISEYMNQSYETCKTRLGITQIRKVLQQQEDPSDLAFSFLHPDQKLQLSKLLKGPLPLLQVKKKIIWNCDRNFYNQCYRTGNKMFDLFASDKRHDHIERKSQTKQYGNESQQISQTNLSFMVKSAQEKQTKFQFSYQKYKSKTPSPFKRQTFSSGRTQPLRTEKNKKQTWNWFYQNS